MPLQIWIIGLGVILILVALYLFGRWLSRYAKGEIHSRLGAMDEIVREDKVPEDWLQPHRERMHRLKEAGAGDAQVEGIAEIARKKCLVNIQELIRYAQRASSPLDEVSRQQVIESLRANAAQWETMSVEVWMDQVINSDHEKRK